MIIIFSIIIIARTIVYFCKSIKTNYNKDNDDGWITTITVTIKPLATATIETIVFKQTELDCP